MKKMVVLFGLLLVVSVRNGVAMSSEALEKDEVAVLEIPELTQLAGSGDVLPKEMAVQSYSLSASHEIIGNTVGKNVVFNDLDVSRTSDEWTPILLKAAIEGKHFKQATLEVRHPDSSLRVELSDVVITNVCSSDNVPSNGSEGYMNVSYSFQGIALSQTKGRFKGSSSLKSPPKAS